MANVAIEGNEVTIQSAGSQIKVTVREDQTVADALDEMGVDASKLGVDLLIDGQRRDASEVTGSQVTDGQRLAAPPKNASLGA